VGGLRQASRLRARLATAGFAAAGRVLHAPPVPALPEGRLVELAGRGRTYVVDTGPPPGDDAEPPTLMLLHALACTGLLTWYPSLDALRRRYRVVIFDQRWHGRGIRGTAFDLDDCADDTAALADALGVETFVAAGYSMGTLVAQLAWRRHADRVAGLVLCAGTTHFPGSTPGRLAVEAAGTRLAARALRRPGAAGSGPEAIDDRWAWRQFRATTGAEVAAVGSVLARFDSRPWIGQANVPAAVVVTARDRLIPPARQRALARALPQATVYEVDAGHASCVLAADRFTPALSAAVASVTGRLAARR
jgi:pimeloyl-ACP methyl ester carboxylesterase